MHSPSFLIVNDKPSKPHYFFHVLIWVQIEDTLFTGGIITFNSKMSAEVFLENNFQEWN